MGQRGGGATERLGRVVGGWIAGRPGLGWHAGIYVSIAVVATLLDVAIRPTEFWVWRPLAWWGVIVAAHAAFVAIGAGRPLAAGSGRAAEQEGRGGDRVGPTARFEPAASGARPPALTLRPGRVVERVRTAAADTQGGGRKQQVDDGVGAAFPTWTGPAVDGKDRAARRGRFGVVGRAASRAREAVWTRVKGIGAGGQRGEAAASTIAQPPVQFASWPTTGQQAEPQDGRRSDGAPTDTMVLGSAGSPPPAAVEERGEGVPASVAALWASSRPDSDALPAVGERLVRVGRAPTEPMTAGPAIRDGAMPGEADWQTLDEEARRWLSQRGDGMAPSMPKESGDGGRLTAFGD